MIRITVELIPARAPDKPRHLGTALITNDGTGTPESGNYTVRLSKWGRPNTTWKTGRVENFPRRKLGPWDLLLFALVATVGKRTLKLSTRAERS